MPPQQQSASHRIRRTHRTVCWGWSPTDFTDLHRWLGCVDSPTEFADLLISGGALVSARLCRLPEQEVHQPSKQWSSHRFHRSTQKLLILGWCTSCSVGVLLTRLVHFLLWQAAKPSGDKCTPLKAAKFLCQSVQSVGEHSQQEVLWVLCNLWENILSKKFCEFCAICGRIYAV